MLAVDDDDVIRGLLQINLELEGYTVVTATDGAQALRTLADARPDLVLLDVMMPDVSGWEVLTTMRADAATADVPVVVLSARAMPADVERGLALGADRYVTKPFDPTDLMTVVADLLAERGAA